MQKINIKKLTKEQMLAMLEEAMSKQEAAEAAAARHFEDGVKLAEENEKLHGQVGELTARIENVGKELDKVRAQYRAADQSAAALKAQNTDLTEDINQMNGEAVNRTNEITKLKAQIEVMDAGLAEGKRALDGLRTQLEKTEKALNEREAEVSEAKKQLVAAEAAAKKKDWLLDETIHRLKMEKKIKETYHESWKWCMAHPWRNLWRCMKEYFFA